MLLHTGPTASRPRNNFFVPKPEAALKSTEIADTRLSVERNARPKRRTIAATAAVVQAQSKPAMTPSKTPAEAESIVNRVLRELRELDEADRLTSAGPVVVFDDISLDDFDEWLEGEGEDLPRWEYEPISATRGRVVVYELSSDGHSAVGPRIIDDIRFEVIRIGNNDLNLRTTLEPLHNRTLTIGNRKLNPYEALVPAGRVGDTIPTLIVEVAYSETLEHLYNKLRYYMRHPGIQVAIGVNMPYRSQAPRHTIIVLQRDGRGALSEQRVEFDHGQQPPNPPPSFPLHKLYHGVAMPPALQGHEDDLIVIDLVTLRELIDRFTN